MKTRKYRAWVTRETPDCRLDRVKSDVSNLYLQRSCWNVSPISVYILMQCEIDQQLPGTGSSCDFEDLKTVAVGEISWVRCR